MASEELKRSWKRTEGFLLEARSHFSDAPEGACRNELAEFENYLRHNELELALDMLEAAFEKSSFKSWCALEYMAMAAAIMKFIKRQQRYDEELTKAQGRTFTTVMPP